ncbi:hypothetical protein TD95_000705 [Thielaviopsis punctulata]|uniref:Uncharacterized protein n=1 Tax=Thielaviopsis punctulata TaxID=72032 RepID=A0A0F4ZHP5_9PEZI|nr:hypothetical protein TD95_000705 [Thielaviopsis punctulata]
MNHLVFARESGKLSGRRFAASIATDLLRSLEYYPHLRFDGRFSISGPLNDFSPANEAHYGGINSLVVDKFQARLMVSGGCDGSVKVWNLEACKNSSRPFVFRPDIAVPRARVGNRRKGHSSGISSVDFDPFDPFCFYTSSFDETVKQWQPDRKEATACFDLQAPVNCFAVSPVSSDKLLACAIGSPLVRLLDPRSGLSSRMLLSTDGTVLALSWSPVNERLLCSGHADGTVKIWDTRRTLKPLAMLDQDDSLGIIHRFDHALLSGIPWTRERHIRSSAHAHNGPVNGISWTDDGNYIVTAGLDQKIRLWDAATGAHIRVNFKTPIYNKTTKALKLLISPGCLMRHSREILYMPNGMDLLAVELHTGTVVAQLCPPADHVLPSEPMGAKRRRTRQDTRSLVNRAQLTQSTAHRVRDIAWRGSGGENLPLGCEMGGGDSHGAIYAAYGDGTIKAFMPKLPGPLEGDDDMDLGVGEREAGRKRKRQGINNVYQSLMTGLR